MIYWLYIICSLCVFNIHDFHVSHTDIKATEQSYEISHNIYVEDIEAAMIAEYGISKLELGTELEHEAGDSLLQDYLEQHFTLIIDNKELELNYLGKELSDDLHSLWIYVESTNRGSEEKLKVINTLLYEIYPDQQNIVNFQSEKGNEQRIIMHRDLTQYEFVQ